VAVTAVTVAKFVGVERSAPGSGSGANQGALLATGDSSNSCSSQ